MRSLLRRRKNRLRRCSEEIEERKRKEKKKTIDELPENVIYKVMNILHPVTLNDFLLAYPRASSIHGVYSLWMRKTKKLAHCRKKLTVAYRKLRERCPSYRSEELTRDYNRFKKNLYVKDRKRIKRLLEYKNKIVISRYNDIIHRRSTRLREKNGEIFM